MPIQGVVSRVIEAARRPAPARVETAVEHRPPDAPPPVSSTAPLVRRGARSALQLI